MAMEKCKQFAIERIRQDRNNVIRNATKYE
jgi:hypothetical protein